MLAKLDIVGDAIEQAEAITHLLLAGAPGVDPMARPALHCLLNTLALAGQTLNTYEPTHPSIQQSNHHD